MSNAPRDARAVRLGIRTTRQFPILHVDMDSFFGVRCAKILPIGVVGGTSGPRRRHTSRHLRSQPSAHALHAHLTRAPAPQPRSHPRQPRPHRHYSTRSWDPRDNHPPPVPSTDVAGSRRRLWPHPPTRPPHPHLSARLSAFLHPGIAATKLSPKSPLPKPDGLLLIPIATRQSSSQALPGPLGMSKPGTSFDLY